MAKEGSEGPGLDTRLAKSVGHPIRIEVMRVLNERTASPSELAEALELGVGDVSYHVQELSKYGCVELVKTEPRRGALEHFYRAARPRGSARWIVGDEEARELSDGERSELSALSLQTVFGEALGALRSGSIGSRPDAHTSWISMELDEEGWGEITSLLAETLDRAQQIEARCTQRLGSRGSGFPAFVSMIAFERTSDPSTAGEEGPQGD